jgi:hypothetical protein
MAKARRRKSPHKSQIASPARERTAATRQASATPALDTLGPPTADDRVFASNLTLHELFQQQTADMLERADLSEEQKQSILIGMTCPCCGAGGFSFTAKLGRGK